jgi:hypothetical protein
MSEKDENGNAVAKQLRAVDAVKLVELIAITLEGRDARISELEGEVDDLNDKIEELEEEAESRAPGDGAYTRADLEAAISGGDKLHLGIVLDSIFGTP